MRCVVLRKVIGLAWGKTRGPSGAATESDASKRQRTRSSVSTSATWSRKAPVTSSSEPPSMGEPAGLTACT